MQSEITHAKSINQEGIYGKMMQSINNFLFKKKKGKKV